MSDLINRLGRFNIPRETLRGENVEDLFKLFGQTIIMRAEYKLTKDVIEYTALSPLFRVKSAAEGIPEYRVECKRINTDRENEAGGVLEVIVEEIKPQFDA